MLQTRWKATLCSVFSNHKERRLLQISSRRTLKDRTNETPLILPVEYSSEDDKNVSEGEVAEEVIQNAQENQEKVTSEV